jgi:nitrite reductase/ring-hydroxylating ferredoxin subunit
MEGWVRVAALDEIPPGRMLAVRVEGEEVAVYNIDGALYATRDQCLHQSYPLTKGALRGKYVRCPLHNWEFDVTTGAYQGFASARLRCFGVRVEGGEVWVSKSPLPPPPPPPPPAAPLSRDEA